MIRVALFFRHSNEDGFDDFRCRDQLLPLIRQLLGPAGLVRVEVDRGVAAEAKDKPPSFSAIIHLVFRSQEEFEAAIAEHGEALSEEMARMSDVEPFVQVSEILVEEDIG